MITRCGRNTASWIEWVTNTTVRFCSCQRDAAGRCRSLLRVISSSAPKGLIHQQQLWPGDQAAGDGDAHLHAAGEFARQDVGELPSPTSSRTSLTPGITFRARHAGQIQRQPDVIAHAAPRHQGGSGRRTTADAGLSPGYRAATASACRRWLHQAGDHLPPAYSSRSRTGRGRVINSPD